MRTLAEASPLLQLLRPEGQLVQVLPDGSAVTRLAIPGRRRPPWCRCTWRRRSGSGDGAWSPVAWAAALVLLVFSLIFNIGMAVVRTKFMDQSLYIPGAAYHASGIQGGLGAVFPTPLSHASIAS